MKLATWNVNSLQVRLPQVLHWLQAQAASPMGAIDVLALQEVKLENHKFPTEEMAQAGYQSYVHGQKTYNGVALLVRNGWQVQEVQRQIPGLEDDPQARLITATLSGPVSASAPGATQTLRVCSAYFPNGQDLQSVKFVYKMHWLSQLQAWVSLALQQASDQAQGFALLGDFNVTADDRDTCDPQGMQDTIHHSRQERAALQNLRAAGLVDSFRQFEQPERCFSWWDYRMLAFRKNQGLRIDYIYLNQVLAAQCLACTIDKAPRKWQRPSDHAPVVCTLGTNYSGPQIPDSHLNCSKLEREST